MCWRLLLVCAASLLLASASGHSADQLACTSQVQLAECLEATSDSDDDELGSSFARLFPGLQRRAWADVPLTPDGRPVRVMVADSPLMASIRSGLLACAAAAGRQLWREEHSQLAQGGSIELWLFAALRQYPHLTDNVTEADVVVPLLPLTLAAQMVASGLFTCTPATLNPPSKRQGWPAVYDAVKQAVAELDAGAVAAKAVWLSIDYHARIRNTFLFEHAAYNASLHVDLGPRPKRAQYDWLYVPSTPLQLLTALVARCPCTAALSAKRIPFFFVSARRATGNSSTATDGYAVKKQLQQVDWRLFPGSRVEIVPFTFVLLPDDQRRQQAASYAADIVRAKFCLILAGGSLNVRRLWEAMVAGCVPVFLSQWKEQRPFSWLHNGTFWQRISVTVDNYRTAEDIQRALVDVYRMPLARYNLLHRQLRAAVADITWGFGDPLAQQPVFGRAHIHFIEEAARRIIEKNISN